MRKTSELAFIEEKQKFFLGVREKVLKNNLTQEGNDLGINPDKEIGIQFP